MINGIALALQSAGAGDNLGALQALSLIEDKDTATIIDDVIKTRNAKVLERIRATLEQYSHIAVPWGRAYARHRTGDFEHEVPPDRKTQSSGVCMEGSQASNGRVMSVRARILRALRLNKHCPSELAELLQIPLKELQSEINGMTQKGFDISQHPLLGLELHTEPEHLTPDQIESYMPDCWLKKIETHSSTQSTNTLALESGINGESGPAVFIAESQTAGRGRFGRVWESVAGEGLWMSLLLRPAAPMDLWPRITTIAAVAIVETLEALLPLEVKIKWPNDVICQGKKIAGILAETGNHSDTGSFIVLGIGLNVNQSSFSEAISNTATSLRILTKNPQNRARIAANLLTRIHELMLEIETGFSNILVRVNARSQVLGKKITANVGGSVVEGIAEGLDQEGCLIIRLENGEKRVLNAGEVTLRGHLQAPT